MAMKSTDSGDMQTSRRYHKASENAQAARLDANEPAYMRRFLHFVRDAGEEATVEYALQIIYDELLLDNSERATWFHTPEFEDEDVYLPFSRLLTRSSWLIQEKASRTLTLAICSRPKDVNTTKTQQFHDAIQSVLSWVCSQLRHPSHPTRGIPTAVSCLVALLRTRHSEIRTLFIQSDGIKLIAPVISPASSAGHVQVLYETTLCMWMLSYHEDAVMTIETTGTVRRLVEVIRTSSKEKMVRVAALTLKNLVTRDNLAFDMAEAGLVKAFHNLRQRSAWSDEELTEALDSIEATLKDNVDKFRIIAFKKYKQDLLSGNPNWTLIHKDPLFWTENVLRFEKNDFQMVHSLVNILNNARHPKSLAIACHDLSCFVQKHPSGREALQRLKITARLLQLTSHEDSDVARKALVCAQRILLSSKHVSPYGDLF